MEQMNIDKLREEFTKNDDARDQDLAEPLTIKKIRNLSYGPYGTSNLFDIYYPKGTTDCLPTIISIHGGGFFTVTKNGIVFIPCI